MEEEYNDHFWLNLILIFYIGLGSFGTFLINIFEIDNELEFPLGLIIFLTGLTFPIVGISTVLAFKERKADAVYLASLYLIYNAFSSLIQLEFLPVIISIACFLYFHTSGLIEYLYPYEIWRIDKRFYILTGVVVIGIIGQLAILYW